MKGKKLKYPYQKYRGYTIWHEKEGRYYVCLIPRTKYKAKLKRTTTALARYKLSVKLGRRLSKLEHVDHIDGNKTNDATKNLQILTSRENSVKSVKERGLDQVWRKLKCPICEKRFKRKAHRVDLKIAAGKHPCCSRRCGYKQVSLTLSGR